MPVLKRLPNRYSFINKGYFLAYYYPRNHDYHEIVSEQLLNFKDNREPITSKWIDIAVEQLPQEINVDLIIRVLSSGETSPTENGSLDKLGRRLSAQMNTPYNPDCLIKSRATGELKYLKRAEREEMLNGIYEFNLPENINRDKPRILLIDDVVTSGSTVKEINRAIRSEIGEYELILFVIGKTYDSWRDEDANNDAIANLLGIVVSENTTQTNNNSDTENDIPSYFDEIPPPSEEDLF